MREKGPPPIMLGGRAGTDWGPIGSLVDASRLMLGARPLGPGFAAPERSRGNPQRSTLRFLTCYDFTVLYIGISRRLLGTCASTDSSTSHPRGVATSTHGPTQDVPPAASPRPACELEPPSKRRILPSPSRRERAAVAPPIHPPPQTGRAMAAISPMPLQATDRAASA